MNVATKPNVVLIHLEGGNPTIIGGTIGTVVYILDYDLQEDMQNHPSVIVDPVDCSMTQSQILNYIKTELHDTNTIDE